MTAEFDQARLLAVAWKDTTVQTFIATCGTTNADGYQTAIRHDDNGNLSEELVIPRPNVVALFKDAAGAVDKHNRIRQGTYSLETRLVPTMLSASPNPTNNCMC